MWMNNDLRSRPFIFFLFGKSRAINNHGKTTRPFLNSWTPSKEEKERWRSFFTDTPSYIKPLAPELITYWKDEE